MNKIAIKAKRIVTVNRDDAILKNHVIVIEDGFIKNILPFSDFSQNNYNGQFYDFGSYTLIPGFIQTHIHLCQTLFRGTADDLALLDWLQRKIFPFENAHNENSLKVSAQLGLLELQKSGTTTIVDMGTIRHHEVVMEELINSEMRAFSGKCMMDMNDLYPEFKEDTKESLDESYKLAKEYHNSNKGKIKYGFAPRFVLSCTEELLKETKNITADFPSSLYHTHSSENRDEIAAVRKMHGKENIEYFDSIGILDENTVLAHCIHLNDDEVNSLKRSGSIVAHCPSSNLKLGSGIADIPRYLDEGINVSIGADGAPCNNNLDMFNEMRLAALIQKPRKNPKVMDAKTVFKMATIDAARSMHMENEIGSIEINKKADLALLDLEQIYSNPEDNDEEVYSDIVYSYNSQSVKEVMIEGEWVLRKGESVKYDKNELLHKSRSEFNQLIKRIN